jgi:UDP-N-acetylglucosamine 2-epimerase (non-hydrolysing)
MGRLLLVAGTRPEAIKIAPIVERLQKLKVDFVFVWSGQHYDYEMSRRFFEELGLPNADYNLDVKGSTHAQQTAEIMVKLEKVIRQRGSSLVVSEGDTNTVAAAAVASVKCMVPFAHVEAGLRSWNMATPEEVNRRLSDSIASLHFAPTKLAVLNLLSEGVSRKGLHLTGNTIVDIVDKHKDTAREVGEKLLCKLNLDRQKYLLATLHREENTDNPSRMRNILRALGKLSEEFRVVFPVHPRTRKRIAQLGLRSLLKGTEQLKPMGYWEFLGLLMNCLVVVTDSGGVSEEACGLRVPCVTLRYSTERPETLMCGNVLAGDRTQIIIGLVHQQAERSTAIRRKPSVNPFGDGHAGDRIAAILKSSIEANLKIVDPDLRRKTVRTYGLLGAQQINHKRSRI